ncbi:hypothetical protein AVEN_144258-1 [Araneus ventricosus]|uniref:Uncharacterized protein n=1 Tax=Araneus ventricosus TaxID=182803 RepID=A0A4Y2D373_ARAVE|nr:hypothetical protein AVEN_91861-1 [Araneus ventricosus]GBM10630.1 hypothetical protein AVEN_144258-1 [Araneus ventricosus]
MCITFKVTGGRSGLVAWSRGRRTPGSKPDSSENPARARARCTIDPTPWAKSPPANAPRKLGERSANSGAAPSSDRKSKLRGLSQISPLAASKWDVNITKLKIAELFRCRISN